MEIINLSAHNQIYACCYLIISGSHAFIVDPGLSLSMVKSKLQPTYPNITFEGILLTHGHFDHILSLSEIKEYTKAPVFIHELDNEMLSDSIKNAYHSFYGMERNFGTADKFLVDNDIIPIGDEQIKVIHTPGHTRGSVCFLCNDKLITGDTLFAEGYGRCDFYGGDFNQIYKSINEKLCTLPLDITVYPGHGYSCKLSEALQNLPF